MEDLGYEARVTEHDGTRRTISFTWKSDQLPLTKGTVFRPPGEGYMAVREVLSEPRAGQQHGVIEVVPSEARGFGT